MPQKGKRNENICFYATFIAAQSGTTAPLPPAISDTFVRGTFPVRSPALLAELFKADAAVPCNIEVLYYVQKGVVYNVCLVLINWKTSEFHGYLKCRISIAIYAPYVTLNKTDECKFYQMDDVF